MKKFILLSFIIFGTAANATDYYISSNGNDANNGKSASTPWRTLNKLNDFFSSLKPGDNVLLKRGDVFYGSITAVKSGTAASPITIGAYGLGVKPVITGFTEVTSWTNLGGNIWESSSAVSTLSTCNLVVINGKNTPMGRWPNSGYLTYENVGGNTSITSSKLPLDTNWTGAQVVIRKFNWVIDVGAITNQTSKSLIYSGGSSFEGVPNNGFFIQNDARTLDSLNEWYYNPSTKRLRIYSPNTASSLQMH